MQQRSRLGVVIVLSCVLFAALTFELRDVVRAQVDVTVHLPVVNLPATVVDRVAARGRLTLNGVPLTNTPFELRSCDSDVELPLATGVTNDAGAFLLVLPIADPATPLHAMLVYPAAGTPPARGSLASFTSVCVPSQGVTLRLPDIELHSADFVSPAKAPTVDMPILFAWEPRSHPGAEEMYQVVGTILYDCSNCDPVSIAAAALPHPSASIMLECVYTSWRTVLSGEFRVMVSNASGVGFSDPYAFNVGHTQRCAD